MSQAGGNLISLVIPVYNEKESLRPLLAEIDAISSRLPVTMEILFVDDGSTDGSWEVLEALRESDDRVSTFRFRRNFGKAAALAAGFSAALGELVFTLDADLQDDPAEIPRFIEKMAEGFDVVSGWKKIRLDPWHKTIPSRIFNWAVGKVTGVRLHDHNCGFKCYRCEVLDEIELYGEFHRFTPVLAHAKGFRVGEISIGHRARRHGHSKYGFERLPRGFVDMLTVTFLTSYHNRPQHLLGTLGLGGCFLGAIGIAYLVSIWVLTNVLGAEYAPIGTRPLLSLSATAILLGAQMLSIGLIAELITARNQSERHVYSIAEKHLAPARSRQTTRD